MFQDVEQIAALDVEDDVLEPDGALGPELRVLRVVPVEVLHLLRGSTLCARKAHVGVGQGVPRSVPKRGPRTIMRQPTPDHFPKVVLRKLPGQPFKPHQRHHGAGPQRPRQHVHRTLAPA